jgi:hypothetical protein
MFSRLKTEYFEASIGGRDINREDESAEEEFRIIMIVARY